MQIRPVSLKFAQGYVRDHHRHNKPPTGHKFSVGLFDGERCVGVATAGRPVARMLNDGMTLEVTRTCTDGTRNANSMLYGAIVRAATALGYHKCVTYTQHDESGASLRGAGWTIAQQLSARAGWDAPSRRRCDIGSGGVARVRWERVCATSQPRPSSSQTSWHEQRERIGAAAGGLARYRANYDRIFGSVRVTDGATHWAGCHRVHPECRRRLEEGARRDEEDAQDETLNAGSLA